MITAANGHKGKVESWDTTYWAERQKEKLYAFSEEELRPYFPLPKVTSYNIPHTRGTYLFRLYTV
jgi:Zn-dependent oligopeptidase